MRPEMMFVWAFVIIANVYFAVDKPIQGLSFLIIGMLVLLIDTFFLFMTIRDNDKQLKRLRQLEKEDNLTRSIIALERERNELLYPPKRKRGRPKKIKPLHNVHFP